MATLYVLCGLPASGKSTWCLIHSKASDAVVVSSDAIRAELFGSESEQKNAKQVFEVFHQRVAEALNDGHDVFADSTAMTKWERASTLKAGRNASKRVCICFETPVHICKERNQTRTRKVPEFVYDKMLKKYQAPSYEEGFDAILKITGE